jgi:transposase InsO family protein
MLIATWPADARRGAVTEFCRTHGISRSQFYEIRRIAQEHSPLEAVAPARAPRQRPDLAVAPGMVEAAIRVRKELAGQGWDHGPISVRHRLLEMGLQAPSRASLARIFTAAGMVTPQPQKRPRSSWRRFTFAFVHECWQLDATEWRLGDGQEVTIFQLLDDHSRFIVGSWVDTGETSAAAVAVLRAAVEAHQPPQRACQVVCVSGCSVS